MRQTDIRGCRSRQTPCRSDFTGSEKRTISHLSHVLSSSRTQYVTKQVVDQSDSRKPQLVVKLCISISTKTPHIHWVQGAGIAQSV
jgi:hypothetical protein